jgi:hypothetical protein
LGQQAVTSQISVGNTKPERLASGGPGCMLIVNTTSVDVWLGDSNVTPTTGLLLANIRGTPLKLSLCQDWYAITKSGTAIVAIAIGACDSFFLGTPPADSAIKTATVTLTSAQLKALNVTPVQLIAAPGAGKAIVPLFTSANYTFGGTAYGVAGQVEITYSSEVGLGKWTQAIFPSNNFLTAVSSQLAVATLYGPSTTIPVAGIFPAATIANQGIVAANTAAAINTGNGTLTLTIVYMIVDVS